MDTSNNKFAYTFNQQSKDSHGSHSDDVIRHYHCSNSCFVDQAIKSANLDRKQASFTVALCPPYDWQRHKVHTGHH